MRTIETAAGHRTGELSVHVPWTYIDHQLVAKRASSPLTASPRPFVRWAGSKQRLLSQIIPHLPTRYRTYHEPFMGAGSMYFLLRPNSAVLNDRCKPLMEMYETVRVNYDKVYDNLQKMNVLDKDEYYHIRGSSPTDRIQAAVRFIYLNRAAWNGLYRVNSRGEFNVPYGRPRSSTIVDKQHLTDASRELANPGTILKSVDFEESIESVRPGDLVFLDPPYASSKKRDGFIDYNEELFTWDDQIRLAEAAEYLQRNGAYVLVTNAYNSAIRALYPSFREYPLVRRSSLASKSTARRPVAESLLVS